MNKKQKYLMMSASSLIVISFIIWFSYGSEIFTKTQVLVEKKDELFGWSEKHWVDKFIPGLDLTLAVSVVMIIITAALYYLFKKKPV